MNANQIAESTRSMRNGRADAARKSRRAAVQGRADTRALAATQVQAQAQATILAQVAGCCGGAPGAVPVGYPVSYPVYPALTAGYGGTMPNPADAGFTVGQSTRHATALVPGMLGNPEEGSLGNPEEMVGRHRGGGGRGPGRRHSWWGAPWWGYSYGYPWYGLGADCEYDPYRGVWVCPGSPIVWQPGGFANPFGAWRRRWWF